MEIVTKETRITRARLQAMARARFGGLVKAVVDVEKRNMAVDAELHSDQEGRLMQDRSEQKNLWGINLYPELEGEDFIEFDSMINVRPTEGNRSRGVDDPQLRERIRVIVSELVE